MNKKTFIIFLSLVLTLSAATNIIFAVSLKSDVIIENEAGNNNSIEYSSSVDNEAKNTNATKKLDISKFIKTSDETEVIYATSKNIADNYTIDIYNDSNNNEYWFSDSEEFVGYIYNDNPTVEEFLERRKTPDEKRPLNDKDDAVAFAKDFAKNVFGEKINDYVLSHTADSGDSYTITFKLTAGEDGFITIRKCGVRVSKYGFIESCTTTIMDNNYDANSAKLENITKADLTSYASAKLTEILGAVNNISINKAFLDKGGNNVALQVTFDTTAKITREICEKYGISIMEGSRYSCSFIYYPLS